MTRKRKLSKYSYTSCKKLKKRSGYQRISLESHGSSCRRLRRSGYQKIPSNRYSISRRHLRRSGHQKTSSESSSSSRECPKTYIDLIDDQSHIKNDWQVIISPIYQLKIIYYT